MSERSKKPTCQKSRPHANNAAERFEILMSERKLEAHLWKKLDVLLVRDVPVVPEASDAAERLEAMYVRKAWCPTFERCTAQGQWCS
jgi:hypothetical protein